MVKVLSSQSHIASVIAVTNGHKPAVDTFCEELSPVNSQIIHDSVTEIAGLQQQIVINMLAIGNSLNRLRSGVGAETFCRFMTDVLPSLGISRSTGYRWLGFAEKLAPLFPNPLIRHHLMALTDGKGLIASLERDGNRDVSRVVLTAAAKAALKAVPPAPKCKDSVECEQWVRQFIKAVGKARSEARSPQQNLPKDRARIIQHFNRFAVRYGLQAAEDLCGHMDKVLTKMTEETEEGSSNQNYSRTDMNGAQSPSGVALQQEYK